MDIIEKVIKESRTVAVVGISDKPDRPSNAVSKYLQANGYKIIPVNPLLHEVLGEHAYPDLKSIPGKVDIVDIFRKSEDVQPIVVEAIKIGAKAVWMQEGVVNQAAKETAEKAGLAVVMDKCMLKEHQRIANLRFRVSD